MFSARHVDYKDTGYFSPIVLDYLAGKLQLRAFYENEPGLAGFEKAIKAREEAPVDRELLVRALRLQYRDADADNAVRNNLELLLQTDCFTVCTAHQPNLFTGPLYFIYKILHTIRLSEFLKAHFPGKNFVPVYYMGSEDADLAELDHFTVEGKTYRWLTDQKGAVGRMKVDKDIERVILELDQQLGVYPEGRNFIELLRKAFKQGSTIAEATRLLVNDLFGKYGLVIIDGDDALLKKKMEPVFRNDLFNNTSAALVGATCEKLCLQYNIQAHPREINLFYLEGNIRERIERKNDEFHIANTGLRFSKSEIEEMLTHQPEKFSPNVILRGLYQETILPNISFIGGGGELAYWLQLKDLFGHYRIPFPILVLRNSFLIIGEKEWEQINKLGFDEKELFLNEDLLLNKMVAAVAGNKVSLNGSLHQTEDLFYALKEQATGIDKSLEKYVVAMETRTKKLLQTLEKKMMRAEKRKYAEQQARIRSVKQKLFPNNSLQERVAHVSSFYARWGEDFIHALYKHSPAVEPNFTVLVKDQSN